MKRIVALWLLILSVSALGGCGYNTLQSQDESIKGAWGEVLNQYQRRADLVPLTVFTRLGTRSARRWYWLSTSPHAALMLSSCDCSVL